MTSKPSNSKYYYFREKQTLTFTQIGKETYLELIIGGKASMSHWDQGLAKTIRISQQLYQYVGADESRFRLLLQKTNKKKQLIFIAEGTNASSYTYLFQ